MTNEAAVLLRNVHKKYLIADQAVHALRGVNLAIGRGKRVAITGKSGAGKSTLLHLIGTLDSPTSGQIVINGTDVGTMDDWSASMFRNSSIGFVFQMGNLLPEFNAIENVMMPGLIAGLKKEAVQERAEKLLSSVGLKDRVLHRPGELSGGEQQRVTIARALLMAPPILLADEPTGNLDQKTSSAVQEVLFNLCEEYKTTMLLVTHDLDLAQRAPGQLVMEDGEVVSGGNLL